MNASHDRELTLDQLHEYNGSNGTEKIFIAVQGVVFDVTSGAQDYYGEGHEARQLILFFERFQGPVSDRHLDVSAGAGYHVLAGKEVARALALMSLKPEDCTSDLTGLTEKQLQTLKQWEERYQKQYPVVGKLVEGKMKSSAASHRNKVGSIKAELLLALQEEALGITLKSQSRT